VSGDEGVIERLVRLLERVGVPYMLTGSIASSHHGLPRATNDADIVIDPTLKSLDRLLALLAAEGYYADASVAREALRGRRQFNVIDPNTAFKMDLIVRRNRPFSVEEFRRREERQLMGMTVAVASAEDVILSKLEWAKKADGSNRQLEDAAGVLRVSGARLDRAYVERWAAELGVTEFWHALLKGEQPVSEGSDHGHE
jgi:hypothetical protein